MTERTLSCARLSRADVEPMHATAANAPRWILLEEPGPGGCDAVLEQRLPPTTAARLKTVAHGIGARVLLICRHGRYTPVGRRCYAVSSKPGASWVEYFSLERAENVLDIDWSPLGQNQRVGGRELPHPLYVVCTNGRHDPCCAEFGRPVADSLQEDYGERVWESAHLGGDRFAANMVLLPEGHYYGRLDAQSAPGVVARYERGLIDLDHYRGRSCYPPPVQAAEYFARRELGLDGVDDLVLRSVTRTPPEQTRVGFGAPVGAMVVVTVQRIVTVLDRRLTCRDGAQGSLVRHELVDLVTSPG